MPKLLSFYYKNPKDFKKGQVFLDIVIAMGLFAILTHAIFSLMLVIYETMSYSRTRLTARHLANERMEVLLNLPYNSLGTTAGIPNGAIPEFETINRDSLNYNIHTSITYFDDPFDNTAPTDLLPTDYKQIRIDVSWDGISSNRTQPIVIVSNIAPKGIENTAGGGIISMMVIDASAIPVSGAQIHITSTGITPQVDMTLQTNNEGRLILPGAPPCSSCYNITTTKNGYTTDKTYTTTEVTNPNKRPLTVTVGQLSETTFIIDRVSSITINSHQNRSQNFISYPNSRFRLTGTKTIGTDVDGAPVFKYDQTLTTNGSGSFTINNLEWDSYTLSIPATENRDISGIYPHQPLIINPNQNITANYALSAHSANSLLLSIKDASNSAVASSSAVLKMSPGYIATVSGGLTGKPDYSQVFFPNLNLGLFSFTITSPEFSSSTGTINIDGATASDVILNR